MAANQDITFKVFEAQAQPIVYKYFLAICQEGGPRMASFPSNKMRGTALFRHPANLRWPTVRKQMYDAVDTWGFRREDVHSVQQIDESNWNASKGWTRFDWQNGMFVMV